MIVPRDSLEPITPEMREALRVCWPDGERLRVAWELARDIDTLHDLLLGLPVHRDRLEAEALASATEQRLVTLSRPVDLMNVETA